MALSANQPSLRQHATRHTVAHVTWQAIRHHVLEDGFMTRRGKMSWGCCWRTRGVNGGVQASYRRSACLLRTLLKADGTGRQMQRFLKPAIRYSTCLVFEAAAEADVHWEHNQGCKQGLHPNKS